ncbi:CpsD/CapB family tyrosine-protein kinase [Salimicrobium sp. PL1-032A]|uniref:CpsD/CapB family tyrosine-protein kinase n=1 Tax=Salimicrobium sp. PL1-032A TaxID=3095364 RepID=UPI0032619636
MFDIRRSKQNTREQLYLEEGKKSTEQIRIIRTNIEQGDGSGRKCLMLTAPGPVKRKSLITAKLALSFAEQGRRTLLIDANAREPVVHEWFHLDNTRGLSDAMAADESAVSFIQETFQPGLYVLPAGSGVGAPGRLWTSERIEQAISGCRDAFDIVLVEAPELLSVADSLILMNHCDGVVMVTKSGHSRPAPVLKTKEMIERARKPLLGVIFQTR